MIEERYKVRMVKTIDAYAEDYWHYVYDDSPNIVFTGSEEQCKDFAWMMNRARHLKITDETLIPKQLDPVLEEAVGFGKTERDNK